MTRHVSTEGRLGLHIIDTPSGRYTFVGSVPTELCELRTATRADVLGGRAFKNSEGDAVAWTVPSFATMAEAMDHASEHMAPKTDKRGAHE